MKRTNNLSKLCKIALMLPAVAVVLTFTSCQKDDLFPEAVDASQSETGVSPLRATRRTVTAPYTITFEDPRVVDYLAGPTAYGENLYFDYEDYDKYYGYDDQPTGLFMMLNTEGLWYDGYYDFRNGGIAISRWNNMVVPDSSNQCSVYYADSITTYGGYGGSETFAVHFGYNDPAPYPYTVGDARTYVTFYDPDQTCVFDYFYVCNNTYASLAMQNGYFVARPLDYAHQDWFKVVIEGIDANDNVTGTVEFYLADFRTLNSPGILNGWHRVDLDTLGSVTALRFDVQGSDVNEYNSLNTPAYFCFDNLTIQQFD
jgi:hypothetical protein